MYMFIVTFVYGCDYATELFVLNSNTCNYINVCKQMINIELIIGQ